MISKLRRTLITNHIEDSTDGGRIWARDLKQKTKQKPENIVMMAWGCALIAVLISLIFWSAEIGACRVIDFKINQLW